MKLSDKKIAEKLAKNLRDLRKDNDLSQQKVANYLNIDRSTYAYYETGKTPPSIFTLINLSKFYNIDIKILLKGII